MHKLIQKTIDWGIKIASLAITAPATWMIATQLFADITSPLLFFVMRLAAVFLIEGVLISNWLLLEFDRTATPEIKVRYGITALAMYIALLVIAWEHEGATGLVFRIALLAALLGSGWDTYVYTWKRATSRVDRTPEKAGRVRRHARVLSIKEAILRRNAEHASQVAFIEAKSMAALEQTDLYGQRMLASIRLDDKAERIKLIEADEALESTTNGKKKRPQLPSPVVTPPDLVALKFSEDENSPDHQLKRNILGAFADDPSYTEENLASKLGASLKKVNSTIDDLIDSGFLYRDRRGQYVPVSMAYAQGGRTKTRTRRTNGKKKTAKSKSKS